jgi:hypothetical protein
MRTQIALSAAVAAFLAIGAVGAHAQGSITQDPGRAAPGNLGTGRLGPSIPSPTVGPLGGAAGNSPGNSPRSSPSTNTSSGGTTVFHGTPRGYGSSSSTALGQPAIPPSRSGSP